MILFSIQYKYELGFFFKILQIFFNKMRRSNLALKNSNDLWIETELYVRWSNSRRKLQEKNSRRKILSKPQRPRVVLTLTVRHPS